MLKGQIGILTESGSKRPGTFEEIDPNTPAQPGIVYEHRIKTSLGWLVDPVTQAILGLQTTFTGLEVLYYSADPTTGDIVYQFWYPPTSEIRAMALPVLAIIIGVIIAILGAWFILSQLGIIKGKDPLTMLMEMIPGMIVTIVGGVVTSALPGKLKIVGIAPIGIGLYLLLQPFIAPPGPPVPPPPPGELGAEILTLEVK